jgi:hypothetical protein
VTTNSYQQATAAKKEEKETKKSNGGTAKQNEYLFKLFRDGTIPRVQCNSSSN